MTPTMHSTCHCQQKAYVAAHLRLAIVKYIKFSQLRWVLDDFLGDFKYDLNTSPFLMLPIGTELKSLGVVAQLGPPAIHIVNP